MGARPTKMLPTAFFERPAAKVARDLLGKQILRSRDEAAASFMIIETEAYEGAHDLAAHSSRGRTPRTEILFGPAGRFYVYRIYGLHWMLNVVTGALEEGAAVLIRGLEGVSGPGRVAARLDVDGSFNGRPAVRETELWFEMPDKVEIEARVLRTPRIGVDYAGPTWAQKKLRFVLAS